MRKGPLRGVGLRNEPWEVKPVEERTASTAAGLVLRVPVAREMVWNSDDLSATEALVLLRLLERTVGATAEATNATLAAACKVDIRTIPRVLPRLRDRGYFVHVVRTPLPTLFEWRQDGPLAAAWAARGLHLVAPQGEAALQHRKPSSPVDADAIETAVAALEAARKSAKLIRRGPDKGRWSRLDPEHHEHVARVLWELVGEMGLEPVEVARRLIGAWTLRIPGNTSTTYGNQPFNELRGWNLRWFHQDVDEAAAIVVHAEERRREGRPVDTQIEDAKHDVAEAARMASAAFEEYQRRAAGGGR
jgi:hypothetical protein